MKPFLILQLRPNAKAAEGELNAFLKFGRLSPEEVHAVQMEKQGIPDIDLDNYSGIILGGGPSNVSDPENKKPPEQKRFEQHLRKLLDQVIERDFPFIGECYGLSALMQHKKGIVSKEKYTEAVGPISVHLTEQAEQDPLTARLPKEFRAFVGHKEACQNMVEGGVLLAKSELCPIQMVRIKKNIYGMQFHPELDVEGIVLRINVYKYAGYFPPEDAEKLIANCRKENVTVPAMILKRFIERNRKE